MSSIQALSPQTVRALGSTQVITTPDTVVKESIDNALDANASNIFVEVSSNTLDVIQVRDNGHGIAPEDRELVCKRYCTSKIKDFEDLPSVGGAWLGFRGEALASIAELSGSMVVTTRVEGESVGIALNVGQDGCLRGRESASHPVGTTVRATDLFKHLPVRKQTALKAATKCLAKIKRTLQVYAIARPTVRFSLRVLKAKNDMGDWVYSPKANAGIEDVVMKVVGKECASNCGAYAIEHHGIVVEAFLPCAGAVTSSIAGRGHFLCVDGRPVSASRGSFRQLLTRFKRKLQAARPDSLDIKDPFIRLNIICPPGCYDVNIEPAKDDVVFEDAETIYEAFTKLLDVCYPTSALGKENEEHEASAEQRIIISEDDDDVGYPPEKRQRLDDCDPDEGPRDTGKEAYLLHTRSSCTTPECVDSDALIERPLAGINPFMLAKLNTRPTRHEQNRPLMSSVVQYPLRELSGSSANVQKDVQIRKSSLKPPWVLPTPENSSPARQTDVLEQAVHSDYEEEPEGNAEPLFPPVCKNPQQTSNPWKNWTSAQTLPIRNDRDSTPLSLMSSPPGSPTRLNHSQRTLSMVDNAPEPSVQTQHQVSEFDALHRTRVRKVADRSNKQTAHNRNIESMFAGPKVDRPFQPPRKRQTTEGNSVGFAEPLAAHRRTQSTSFVNARVLDADMAACEPLLPPQTPQHRMRYGPHRSSGQIPLHHNRRHVPRRFVSQLDLTIANLKDLADQLRKTSDPSVLNAFPDVAGPMGDLMEDEPLFAPGATAYDGEQLGSFTETEQSGEADAELWREQIMAWLKEQGKIPEELELLQSNDEKID